MTATGITGPIYAQTINSQWGNTFRYHILSTSDYSGINAVFQQGSATAHSLQPKQFHMLFPTYFWVQNKQRIVASSFTMSLCCFYLWGILKGNTSNNNPRTDDTQRTTCLLGETSVCEHLLDSKKPNHDTLNENVPPPPPLNMVSEKLILTVIHCVGPERLQIGQNSDPIKCKEICKSCD